MRLRRRGSAAAAELLRCLPAACFAPLGLCLTFLPVYWLLTACLVASLSTDLSSSDGLGAASVAWPCHLRSSSGPCAAVA